MSYKINQYQDFFSIYDKIVIVDYFLGKMDIIERKKNGNQFEDIISEEYFEKEKMYFERTREIDTKKEYTVVIIPSYNCNMVCEYCYEGHQKNISTYISEKEGERIVEFLKEHEIERMQLVLLGGEPIFDRNLEILTRFVQRLERCNVKYDVMCVSNGLEVAKHIEEIKQLNISHMQLTLDGGETVHNRRKRSQDVNQNPFKETCNAIDILLKNNIEVALRVNVDGTNVNQIQEIYNIILEKKWNKTELFYAYIYPVTYSGNDKKQRYLSEKEVFELVLLELQSLPDGKNVFKLDFHGIEFIDSLVNNKMFVPMRKFCASCSNQIVFDGNKKIYTCWWGDQL